MTKSKVIEQETYIELHTKPLLRAYRQEMYKLAQTQLKEPETDVKEKLTTLKKCYDILKDVDKDEAESLQSTMSLN
jgi:hypothetical protein